MKVHPWIIDNVKLPPNHITVLPRNYVSTYGKENIEQAIKEQGGINVEVFSKRVPKYDDMAMATMGNKVKLRTEKEQWWFVRMKEEENKNV